MRVNGKRIFLENHSIENLDKMYLWCTDKETVEMECGQPNQFKDIEEFKNAAMAKFIKCNHDSNSDFCHFALYKADDGELIGSVDFFDINETGAEVSWMIGDRKHRRKGYGTDAFFTALGYGFKIKNWEVVIVSTRIDNDSIKNMCAKLGLDYETEHLLDDYYNIGILKYQITRDIYDKIAGDHPGKALPG